MVSGNECIAVIGLGYVGLPLAIEFGKKYQTIGFDINKGRIDQLKVAEDITREVDRYSFSEAYKLHFTSDESDISKANTYIVTVPTPIDSHRQPDLTPLQKASELIGRVISKGDIVIYESTVYPGATEEDCIPVVELVSGLKYNVDFYAGYSPERINPGDKQRPVTKITKVTSGSNEEAAEYVDHLYRSIIEAGTFKAKSIKVAEASKIIENTQRDVNIALMNELSMVFSHMDISTSDVIAAASTKWNFIPMSPGLVGGHCIGVDPYYLVHKSMAVGHIPDIIRTSREINDGMPKFSASKLVKEMIVRGMKVKGADVLVLGCTFKENCPDIRNTKVVYLIEELESYGVSVKVHDVMVDADEFKYEYGRTLFENYKEKKYDAVVLAVPHSEYIEGDGALVESLLKPNSVVFDMKAKLPSSHNIISL